MLVLELIATIQQVIHHNLSSISAPRFASPDNSHASPRVRANEVKIDPPVCHQT